MLWGWSLEASVLTDAVLAEVDLAGGSVGSDSQCPVFLLLCSWDPGASPHADALPEQQVLCWGSLWVAGLCLSSSCLNAGVLPESLLSVVFTHL